MLSPPMPLPCVMSPPCAMKPAMMRWKGLPLRDRGTPALPTPFSPVTSALKFSTCSHTHSQGGSADTLLAPLPAGAGTRHTHMRTHAHTCTCLLKPPRVHTPDPLTHMPAHRLRHHIAVQPQHQPPQPLTNLHIQSNLQRQHHQQCTDALHTTPPELHCATRPDPAARLLCQQDPSCSLAVCCPWLAAATLRAPSALTLCVTVVSGRSATSKFSQLS